MKMRRKRCKNISESVDKILRNIAKKQRKLENDTEEVTLRYVPIIDPEKRLYIHIKCGVI